MAMVQGPLGAVIEGKESSFNCNSLTYSTGSCVSQTCILINCPGAGTCPPPYNGPFACGALVMRVIEPCS